MPITIYKCSVCYREHNSIESAEICEEDYYQHFINKSVKKLYYSNSCWGYITEEFTLGIFTIEDKYYKRDGSTTIKLYLKGKVVASGRLPIVRYLKKNYNSNIL